MDVGVPGRERNGSVRPDGDRGCVLELQLILAGGGVERMDLGTPEVWIPGQVHDAAVGEDRSNRAERSDLSTLGRGCGFDIGAAPANQPASDEERQWRIGQKRWSLGDL